MLYSLRFFSLQNAVCFIMLTCLVYVLFTFYIQDVLKLKKNNSGAKRLRCLLFKVILDEIATLELRSCKTNVERNNVEWGVFCKKDM